MITHLINYVVLGLLEFNPQMTLKPINYANNSCIKKRHLELVSICCNIREIISLDYSFLPLIHAKNNH